MTFLFDYAIKASIIVAIALTIVRLIPGKSAAFRHWILSAAVFCVYVSPIASLVLPVWNVGRVIVVSSSIPSSIEARSPTAVGAAAIPLRAQTGASGRLVFWIWLAGVFLGALTLLIGSIRLYCLSSYAGRDVAELWTAAAGEISKRYRLRNPVQLLRSRNSAILVTWGVFRPKVLLPAGSGEWPEERIRAVLCHELSHIRRGDWWIQTTAEVLRAVLWFNPLVWILCRRLRVESEYACDDAVLAQGITGPEYAAQLLDIVSLLQVTDRPWSSALGMASPTTIERRFAAMLNPRVNRRSVSRISLLVIAIAALGLTLPLAALSTSPRIQTQAHDPISTIPVSTSIAEPTVRLQAPAVRPRSRELSLAGAAVVVSAPPPVQPSQVSAPAPTTPQQQSQFKGEKISLDVNALDDFLKLMGTTSGLNVILDPSVGNIEPFTLRLTDVPWDQALDIVLRQNHLVGQLDGNVLRIRQTPTPVPESITMDFEIYRNGLLLGAPRITAVSTHGATIVLSKVNALITGVVDGDIKITATPTATSDNRIRIQLEIFVDKSGVRDVLVVSNGEQRSISWRSSAGETLEARVTASEKK